VNDKTFVHNHRDLIQSKERIMEDTQEAQETVCNPGSESSSAERKNTPVEEVSTLQPSDTTLEHRAPASSLDTPRR